MQTLTQTSSFIPRRWLQYTSIESKTIPIVYKRPILQAAVEMMCYNHMQVSYSLGSIYHSCWISIRIDVTCPRFGWWDDLWSNKNLITQIRIWQQREFREDVTTSVEDSIVDEVCSLARSRKAVLMTLTQWVGTYSSSFLCSYPFAIRSLLSFRTSPPTP